MLRSEEAFDLILFGDGKTQDEGSLESCLQRYRRIPHAGTAAKLRVRSRRERALQLQGADGQSERTCALPASVGLEASLTLRSFRVEGFLAGLSESVEIVRWPKKIPARLLSLTIERASAVAADERPGPLTPEAAARRLLSELGHGGGASLAHGIYDGPLEDVVQPNLFENATAAVVMAVVSADAEGRLQPSAALVLRAAHAIGRGDPEGSPARVVVFLLAPTREDLQRRALAQLAPTHQGTVIVLPSENLEIVRGELLIEGWRELLREPGSEIARSEANGARNAVVEPPERVPHVVVGEPWAEDAFSLLCVHFGQPEQVALRVRQLAWSEGEIICTSSHAGGKLSAAASRPCRRRDGLGFLGE